MPRVASDVAGDPLDLERPTSRLGMAFGWLVFVLVVMTIAAWTYDGPQFDPGNQDPKVGWVEKDGQRFRCVDADLVYANSERVVREAGSCL
jgi:hypothetical protein